MGASKSELSRHRACLQLLKVVHLGVVWLLSFPFSWRKGFWNGATNKAIFLQSGLKNNQDGEICRYRAVLEVLKGKKKLNKGLRKMKRVDFLVIVLGLTCWKWFCRFEIQGHTSNSSHRSLLEWRVLRERKRVNFVSISWNKGGNSRHRAGLEVLTWWKAWWGLQE